MTPPSIFKFTTKKKGCTPSPPSTPLNSNPSRKKTDVPKFKFAPEKKGYRRGGYLFTPPPLISTQFFWGGLSKISGKFLLCLS